MSVRISVILPVYRLRHRLRATLASLEAQTLPKAAFECIFIDDASADGSAETVEAWQGSIARRVLRNATNLGRSRTRNRGWRAASGDIVVFLDGDMIAHPRLLEIYLERFAARDVDVVSGRRWCIDLRPHAGSGDELIARLAKRTPAQLFRNNARADFAALLGRSHLGMYPTPGQATVEREVAEVCRRFPDALTRALAFVTSNVAVRAKALSETRGFLPLLARGEDTELGLQLATAGKKFEYATDAEAIHPFEGFTGTSEENDYTREACITLYPMMAVALWWIWWAQVPSVEPAADRSLLARARTRLRASAPLRRMVEFAQDQAMETVKETEDERVRALGTQLLSRLGFARAPYSRLVDIARAEADGSIREVGIGALAKDLGVPLPAELTASAETMAAHLASRFRISTEQAAGYLERAVAAGVLHDATLAGRLFDRALTVNWLCDHSDLRVPGHRGAGTARGGTVTWRGRYEVSISGPLARDRGGDIAINLALPTRGDCQSDVTLTDWNPPDLAGSRRGDLIVAYPLGAAARSGVRLGYTFSCVTRAWDPKPSPLSETEQALWSRPVIARGQAQALASLLRTIPGATEGAPSARAQAIGAWLGQETLVRDNSLDPAALLRTGFGHDRQRARLFVGLCRLAGVPARERFGAVIGWHATGGEHTDSQVDRVTPFARTWAEYHCPHDGWVPVDVGGAHGLEPPLAGALDPFRIHTCADVAVLPTVVVRDRRDRTWAAMTEREAECCHTLHVVGQRAPVVE